MSDLIAFHSVLDSAGPQSAAIEWLWWVMFWTTTIVFVVVLTMLAFAVIRGREKTSEARTGASTLTRVVSGSVAATAVILFGLLVASIATGRAIASPAPSSAVTV